MKRWAGILFCFSTAVVLMAAGVLRLYKQPATKDKQPQGLVYGLNFASGGPARQVDRPLDLLRRPEGAWKTAGDFGVGMPEGGKGKGTGAFVSVTAAALGSRLPIILTCSTGQVSVDRRVQLLPVLVGRMSKEPAGASISQRV